MSQKLLEDDQNIRSFSILVMEKLTEVLPVEGSFTKWGNKAAQVIKSYVNMKGDLKYPLVKAFLKLCCETLDHEEVKLQRSWLSWGVDLIPEHAQMWAEEDLAVEEEIDRHAQAFIDTEGDDLSMTADVEMVGEEKVEKTQEKGKGKEREKEIIALILKKTTSAASETAKTAEPGGPAKTVKVEKKEKSKSQAQLQIK